MPRRPWGGFAKAERLEEGQIGARGGVWKLQGPLWIAPPVTNFTLKRISYRGADQADQTPDHILQATLSPSLLTGEYS